MPKKKAKDLEVRTENPLKNGNFDEKAARDVLKMIKEKLAKERKIVL